MFARRLGQYVRKGTLAKPHHRLTRLLHWTTSGLLIYGIARNGEVTGALFDEKAMSREVIYFLLLGVLFIAQFIWIEFLGGGSRLPKDAPLWEHRASRIAHIGVYMLVAYMIFTGLAIAYATPGTVVFLDGQGRATTNDPFLSSLLFAHFVGSRLLFLLLTIHVAAALWHWIVRKDGIWESMIGRLTSPTSNRR